MSQEKKFDLPSLTCAQVLKQAPVSIVITDTQGVITFVNDKVISLTGYSEKELIGATPAVLKSGLTDRKTYDEMWATIEGR